MSITQVPSFTKVPDRGSSPATFSADVDTFLNEINARVVAGNQQADELNQAADQVETSRQETLSAAQAAQQSDQAAAGSAEAAAENAQVSSAAVAGIQTYYLGENHSDPVLDLNGDPVRDGQWYVNTTLGMVRVRVGGQFVAGVMDANGALVRSNNLSDLDSAEAALEHLGFTLTAEEINAALIGSNNLSDLDSAEEALEHLGFTLTAEEISNGPQDARRFATWIGA